MKILNSQKDAKQNMDNNGNNDFSDNNPISDFSINSENNDDLKKEMFADNPNILQNSDSPNNKNNEQVSKTDVDKNTPEPTSVSSQKIDTGTVPESASAMPNEGASGLQVVEAAKNVSNLQGNLQEATDETISDSAKDVALETLKTLPKAAAHAAAQNYAGLAIDAVEYLSKTGFKILKIVLMFLLVFILLVSSLAGAMLSLPSMYVENFIEAQEIRSSEKQLNKAKETLYNAYETVVSNTVSNFIKESKDQLNVSNFSSWKRMMINNENLYSINTKQMGNDSLITIIKRDNTETLSISFKNSYAYTEDFSDIQVNEIAFFNAFSYYNMFKEDEAFKQGEAPEVLGNDVYFESPNSSEPKPEESKILWKKKDTQAFKKWVEENTKSLVTYEIKQNAVIPTETGVIKNFTFNVDTVATEEEIFKLFSFSDKQIERVKELNVLGDLYVSVSDENILPGEQQAKETAIYPFLDVYTNLFPNDSSVPLPKNYHKINAREDGMTNEELIERIIQVATKEILYTGFIDEISYNENNIQNGTGDWTKYGAWVGSNGTEWSSSFMGWVMNEVDNSLNQDFKLIDTVFLKSNVASAQAGFLLNTGVWHNEADYIPRKGDIILLNYSTENQTPIGTIYPPVNEEFANMIVNRVGLVVESNSKQITVVLADNANNSVNKEMISKTNKEIVGYVTPNYTYVTGLVDYGADSEYVYPLRCDYTITADYPRYSNGKNHTGVDFAPTSGKNGDNIYASNAGVIKKVNYFSTSFGYHVIIDHGNGIESLYGHCSSILVKEGDIIEKGQIIARVGSTGNSTGSHVHLEFRVNNKVVNPWNYLKR